MGQRQRHAEFLEEIGEPIPEALQLDHRLIRTAELPEGPAQPVVRVRDRVVVLTGWPASS
jgi:hypothetical protein